MTAKLQTSVRLSRETLEQIKELGIPRSTAIERAIRELHQRKVTGVEWLGSGPWMGWSVTHATRQGRLGEPVILMPNGAVLHPDIDRAVEVMWMWLDTDDDTVDRRKLGDSRKDG